MSAILECKQCGYDHTVENCDRRCHLCGELGGDDASEPLSHTECWEANDADQDIPVGEAARERWVQERKRAVEDYEDYARGGR